MNLNILLQEVVCVWGEMGYSGARTPTDEHLESLSSGARCRNSNGCVTGGVVFLALLSRFWEPGEQGEA